MGCIHYYVLLKFCNNALKQPSRKVLEKKVKFCLLWRISPIRCEMNGKCRRRFNTWCCDVDIENKRFLAGFEKNKNVYAFKTVAENRPPETYKSNFIDHGFVQFGKHIKTNSKWVYRHVRSVALFAIEGHSVTNCFVTQQFCEVCFVSLPVAKPFVELPLP